MCSSGIGIATSITTAAKAMGALGGVGTAGTSQTMDYKRRRGSSAAFT
jgi:hypothetical protein